MRRPSSDGTSLHVCGVAVGPQLAAQRRGLGGEGGAVEAAQAVDAGRAPEHPAGVARVAVHLQLEQVRALPGVRHFQVAQVAPPLQVGRSVQGEVVAVQEQRHDPLPRRCVPDHLGVAVVGVNVAEHGVAGIAPEGAPAVGAVGDRLHARGGARLVGSRRSEAPGGIDRRQGLLTAAVGKARAVVGVDDRRPGPDESVFVRGDGGVEFAPVHQVGAHRVPPGVGRVVHKPRRVLKEQVVFAAVVDQPIGVVHPRLPRAEVELRAVQLVVHEGPQRPRGATTEPGRPRSGLHPGVHGAQEGGRLGRAGVGQLLGVLLDAGLPRGAPLVVRRQRVGRGAAARDQARPLRAR